MTKIDRAWFEDDELKYIRNSSKERIATFFEVEGRAVTIGYILHKLNIDHRTIRKVVEVMMKHGHVERIDTTNYTQYRRKEECQ